MKVNEPPPWLFLHLFFISTLGFAIGDLDHSPLRPQFISKFLPSFKILYFLSPILMY